MVLEEDTWNKTHGLSVNSRKEDKFEHSFDRRSRECLETLDKAAMTVVRIEDKNNFTTHILCVYQIFYSITK